MESVRCAIATRASTVLVALVAVLALGGSATAATWVWSRPVNVDANGGGVAALACPTIRLCIGADQFGRVLTSRSPTGGSNAWYAEGDPNLDPLGTITCPTARLCLGTSPQLNMSTDPGDGASTWQPVDIGGRPSVEAVACPRPALCFAVAPVGGPIGVEILTSRDPAGGRAAWRSVSLHAPPCNPDSCRWTLSCPTAELCVALDSNGVVITSTHPTRGAGAWRSAGVDSNASADPASSLSCPSARWCVFGDGAGGHVFASRAPAGGAAAWRATAVGFDTDWLSCPLTTLCIANQGDAFPFTSDDPLAGAASWRSAAIDPAGTLTAVSCPSQTECVAADGSGDVVTGSALTPPIRSGASPKVTGTPRVGAALTASTGRWSGSPPIRFEDHWELCAPQCRPIPGATGRRYRVTGADLHARVRVRVTAFNTVGSSDGYSRETPAVTGGAT